MHASTEQRHGVSGGKLDSCSFALAVSSARGEISASATFSMTKQGTGTGIVPVLRIVGTRLRTGRDPSKKRIPQKYPAGIIDIPGHLSYASLEPVKNS